MVESDIDDESEGKKSKKKKKNTPFNALHIVGLGTNSTWLGSRIQTTLLHV